MMNDWTGNTQTVMATLNASSHSFKAREQHDYYATDPKALQMLLELEQFENVWECACGQGHLSEILKSKGIPVRSTDLIDRKYGDGQIDFLGAEIQEWDGDIITNPPYKFAKEFVWKALQIIPFRRKIALFLRIQFLEGVARRKLFDLHPPKIIYVSSRNIR